MMILLAIIGYLIPVLVVIFGLAPYLTVRQSWSDLDITTLIMASLLWPVFLPILILVGFFLMSVQVFERCEKFWEIKQIESKSNYHCIKRDK